MSTGRPLSFDPEQALDSAMQLFWAQGFEATSMQDLLRVTGLSKSSLYQRFGSKQQLFVRCIVHYNQQQTEQMLQQLNTADSGYQFLHHRFHAIAERAGTPMANRGCLLMNTASEFAQTHAEFSQQVSAGIKRVHAVFLAAVQRGQQEGEIGKSHTAQSLASYLVSSMSGLKTQAKAGADARQLRETADIILFALH